YSCPLEGEENCIKRAWSVFDREHDRCLVIACLGGELLRYHEEACDVMPVVLNVPFKDCKVVYPRRHLARDRRRIFIACGQLSSLCRARRFFRRDPRHVRFEPTPALRERLGMRIYFLDL